MIVLDTHVLIWWVNGDAKRLSRKARQMLAEHGKRRELLVSSISVFEIATLARRGRLRFNASVSEWLGSIRKLPEYHIEPVTDDIAERAGQFGDAFPGDPADRIIAATAIMRRVPLVTRDGNLGAIEHVQTIW